MSTKDWRVRVDDILDAIAKIESYTQGLSEADFVEDERTIDAVVRNLEIIGEAANRLPFEVQRGYPDIPWSRMAEMRHILVHEYHSVDPSLIWSTIHHDIPPLFEPLRALLREETKS